MAKPKAARFIGVTGHDGSYLVKFLLQKGYVVQSIKRRTSSFNTQRVDQIYHDLYVDHSKFTLHYSDLPDLL